MDLLVLVIGIIIAIGKFAGKNAKTGQKKTSANAAPQTAESAAAENRARADSAGTGAEEHRRSIEKRWAEARRRQEDAVRLHAASVDSCEGRLESLKVLYDAGILDRDEYAQRVERVKALHSHGRS